MKSFWETPYIYICKQKLSFRKSWNCINWSKLLSSLVFCCFFLAKNANKHLDDVLTTNFDQVLGKTRLKFPWKKLSTFEFGYFWKIGECFSFVEKGLISELLGRWRISFERFSESLDSSESDVGNIHQVSPTNSIPLFSTFITVQIYFQGPWDWLHKRDSQFTHDACKMSWFLQLMYIFIYLYDIYKPHLNNQHLFSKISLFCPFHLIYNCTKIYSISAVFLGVKLCTKDLVSVENWTFCNCRT